MVARSLLSAYVLVGVVNVIAVASANLAAEQLTKPVLMPLLIAWLIVEARRTWCPSLLALLTGMAFSWIGDLLLLGDGDLMFAAGLSAFLVTQVAYAIAFSKAPGLRFRRGIVIPTRVPVLGLVAEHRALVLPFIAYFIVMTWLLWPTAEVFRAPFTVYGVALVAMSACALNLVHRVPSKAAWVTFAGSILFVASDSLIALTALGPMSASAITDACVMLAYLAAQGLIALGLLTGVRDVDHARRELADIRR